jgi:Mg-chelatase subunit ChlD
MSQLELNKGDNFIHAIDVSASMQATDTPTGAQRVDYVKETVVTFVGESAKWDEDGVDVFTFGHRISPAFKADASNARSIIDPLRANEGSTDTAGAITAGWKLHRAGGYKQSVLFLYTDGQPNDEAAVFRAIAGITQELKDEHEFAISILTVGTRTPELQAFLTKLDDAVPGAKHDIVDVKALEEVDFMAAFAGALHD